MMGTTAAGGATAATAVVDDPLAEALRALRMQGALFSRAELRAPFGVRSGPLPGGVFHAVVDGGCVLRALSADGPDVIEPIEVAAGDVVYLPHGADHILADDAIRPATPRSQIGTRPGPDGMELLEIDGGGEHTTLLCGRVDIEEDDIHPVLHLLPDVIHVSRHSNGVGARVPALIELLAEELRSGRPGSAVTVARLTDVLVLHMIRHHVEQLTDSDTGWLRAMADPVISQAIGLIHRDPSRAWTAAGLAREVGLSRSTFFERFRRLVGEGPIEYLTRWRMHVANHLLREGQSVAATARAVGYSTEASFSDAFLRVTGDRPGRARAGVGETGGRSRS